MVKSGWVKGVVLPAKQEYGATKINLEGFKITATDEKGKVFSTLTNENGEFEFALPVNNYRITMDIDRDKYSLDKPDQKVFIDQRDNKMLYFNITDEAHKVIVKQF